MKNAASKAHALVFITAESDAADLRVDRTAPIRPTLLLRLLVSEGFAYSEDTKRL